jgi:ABC-2 type transport system ATP-binding protein
VVSVSLDGADPETTRAAIGELSGLERVVVEHDGLILYVEDGPSSIAETVRKLDRGGVSVGAISVARPTLDDVFLKATGRRLEGDDEEQAP